jgi:hypothetical protein
MAEFEEIAHAGGKIEFISEGGERVSLCFEHSTPLPVAVFQICVSLNGRLLDVVPMGSVGSSLPYPQPSIPVWIISDQHGMFGRTCPECKSYFRTNFCGRVLHCPYCGYTGNNVTFTTKNQLEYIGVFFKEFLRANSSKENVTIDLDPLLDRLKENKTPWTYSEKQQQTSDYCPNCQARYDILGEYGGCPGCGKRNVEKVIDFKLTRLKTEIEQLGGGSCEVDAEIDWEKLIRCVSEFEAMAKDLRRQLTRLPATPQRKGKLSGLNFQNIIRANQRLKRWYGFEILKDISVEDRDFINRMFNKRHVFAHNAGRIDQQYLENTGDTTVTLNQVIRLKKSEMGRLIPLVRKSAINLIRGFESIS